MKAETCRRLPHLWQRLTLFQRIMLLVGIGLAASTTFQLAYSERLLENAILSQIKNEAEIFLLGIEREIQGHPWPPQRKQILQFISHALSHDIDVLSFAVESMYVFDRQGNVLIRTEPGEHPGRDMSSYYGSVVKSGEAYMGSDVEWDYDPKLGAPYREWTSSFRSISMAPSSGGSK